MHKLFACSLDFRCKLARVGTARLVGCLAVYLTDIGAQSHHGLKIQRHFVEVLCHPMLAPILTRRYPLEAYLSRAVDQ
jgi:hypothetical protein